MIDINWFIGGFVIGTILYYIGYILIVSYQEKKDFEKHKKWWNDPSSEEFLYDENGEKIWSNKKGCIGLATYIKKYDNS